MRLAIGSLLLMIFTSCNSADTNDQEGINGIDDLKTRQYAIQGQQLYLQHCSNCHQEDGTGLNRLIPPLRQADYMMPGNNNLTPLEIAQIGTYIYNIWGNDYGLITPEKVNEALNQ